MTNALREVLNESMEVPKKSESHGRLQNDKLAFSVEGYSWWMGHNSIHKNGNTKTCRERTGNVLENVKGCFGMPGTSVAEDAAKRGKHLDDKALCLSGCEV